MDDKKSGAHWTQSILQSEKLSLFYTRASQTQGASKRYPRLRPKTRTPNKSSPGVPPPSPPMAAAAVDPPARQPPVPKEPSLDPYVGRLERFELFSTNQCYYLVSTNSDKPALEYYWSVQNIHVIFIQSLLTSFQ